MDLSNKTTKIGIVLLALLLIAGLTLFYSGSDAVAVALEKKEGILTAEQVKVAFDSVGGRMVNEAVQEGQTVKKGDVLMIIDSTDVGHSVCCKSRPTSAHKHSGYRYVTHATLPARRVPRSRTSPRG